ncbi:MAG: 16S rRNA (uracil(1498)-N(3))-methyltransferase [Actinomycetota bacterium]|nr:16S rRNA (uracil(1498)-N(3))-methyltransferase [Actinomycetota bacterium]
MPDRIEAPWRDAAALVFVDSLETPVLAEADHHHLARVLRLRPGVELCATDGAGGWRRATFDGTARLVPLGDVGVEPRPSPPLTVAFALVKGEKPELVVQKLTELGVDRIVPVDARHSVVRWDEERARKHLERLRRVAREACSQCRRLWVPEVDEVRSVAALRAEGAVLAHVGGRPLRRGDTVIAVGPEGGWSDDELDGADTVTLGAHVLRAETAAITAGALSAALRLGAVGESKESSP